MRWTMGSIQLAALLLSAAWTGGGNPGPGPSPPASSIPTGGTLSTGTEFDLGAQLDPQKEYLGASWELSRCCLLRTLMSYNGRPASEGGAEIRPDLAAGMPQVTADR